MSSSTTNKERKTFRKIYIILIYSAAALIVLGLSAASLESTRNQTHSSVRINLAGRQRMLSQKIVKEIFQYRLEGGNRAKIDSTISIFDTTLHVLLDGGDAPADIAGEEFWEVPAAVAGPTRTALEEVHRLWHPFKNLVNRYHSLGRESDLREIIRSSAVLLERIDDSVIAIQRQAGKDNYSARIMLRLLIIIICTFSAVYLFITIRRLRKATETIQKLEKFLPLCSNCKMIRTRDDPYNQDSWVPLEEYLLDKDGTEITHGLCPQCARELYPDLYEKVLQKRKAKESG